MYNINNIPAAHDSPPIYTSIYGFIAENDHWKRIIYIYYNM